MQRTNQFLEMTFFTSQGGAVMREYLRDAMVLDMERLPPFEQRPIAHDGRCFLPAPDEAFAVGVPLDVEGFGRVWVYADNEGQGYTAASCQKKLNFAIEAARSRLAAVRQAEQRHRAERVAFSDGYAGRMAKAQALLREALEVSGDIVRTARLAMASLAESLHAGEMLVMEHARAAIAARGPRAGFRFGCYSPLMPQHGQEYFRLFSDVFNFATLPFYHGRVEANEGVRDYSDIDTLLAWTQRDHVEPKGHTFIFLGAGPRWYKGRSYEQVKASARDYILDAVGRYRDVIKVWDVINEAHDWSNPNGFTQEQLTDLTRMAAQTTRQADPGAVRIVNCCGTWAEYVAGGQYYNYELGRPTRTPLRYLRDVMSAGIDFEVVGLQLYYTGRDLFEISRHLDMFCALGKPVHITELGISASNAPIVRGDDIIMPSQLHWHGRPWSQTEQADWIEAFYTLCYAKPAIEAISWWDYVDPGFIPHGGLLDEQLRPKEGYRRLKNLIASWR